MAFSDLSILLIISILFVNVSWGYVQLSSKLDARHMAFLFGSKEEDIQRQMKIQQEILSRRKNKGKMKEYFESVEKKRMEVSVQSKKNLWGKTTDSEDPLTAWKQAKDRGEINPLGYEPEPPKSSSILGVNIVLPLNPIGMPKYDNGERFDLRLPYAERGYEDPEADVLGKIGKKFSNLFRFGKKSEKSDKN